MGSQDRQRVRACRQIEGSGRRGYTSCRDTDSVNEDYHPVADFCWHQVLYTGSGRRDLRSVPGISAVVSVGAHERRLVLGEPIAIVEVQSAFADDILLPTGQRRRCRKCRRLVRVL